MSEVSTNQKTQSAEGDNLRKTAVQKLEKARAMILAAADDLRDLEGLGYCQNYEDTLGLADTVRGRANTIQRLEPPTGVFKW